jgi:NADH-quinone oxidoreductase subunit E
MTELTELIGEQTYAELREIAGRYPRPQSALLPMLHLLQSVQGRVTAAGIEACANVLSLSPADVSAVATFYTMYKRRPVGDYLVGVCTNTLCAVMGGDLIFERLKEHLDVGNDETTEDGSLTLEHIECNAACDYAPVVMVNWEFFDNQTPRSALQLVDDLRAGREVTASRGARITSWREAERVLAGFPDGRADEGPAAGPPTLAGLEIARQRGWSAPTPAQSEADRSGDQPGGQPADQPSGSGSGSPDAQAAVAQADTQRAESETQVEASDSEHAQGPGDAEGPGDTEPAGDADPGGDAGSSAEGRGQP